MELIVNRQLFQRNLETNCAVVPSKPAIASLSSVLLEAKENELSFTSSDLETTIKTSCQAKVVKKGSTLLPARKILSLTRQISDEEIRLYLTENQVNLQTENSVYNFFPANIEDFPKLPKFTAGISFSVSATLLKQSIDQTKFCIYPEEPRPHFRGALLDIKENSWNFVATDTRRLALVQKTLETKLPENVKCLLPHRALNYLSNLLKEGNVELSISKNQIFLKIDTTYIISQLLEGSEDFPDYRKVIPDEKKQNIAVAVKDQLELVLKRIALFTTERYNKVKFVFSKGKIILSVSNPEVGEAQEKLPVDYQGQDQPIAFNPDYLLDFLQCVTSEKVIIAFSSDKKPVLLRPQDNEDYLYVAMPLKLE